MSRFLIVLGSLILLTGLFWPLIGRLGLGSLPGDIVVQRENTTFYFPLATSLILSVVISVVLSALLWLTHR